MLTDVKLVLQSKALVAILSTKAYHILNLQFRMNEFLLTTHNSSYDVISIRKTKQKKLIVILLN